MSNGERPRVRRFRSEHWLLFVSCLVGASPLARADAPPGWYTTPFEVVYDTKTRLYWQRGLNAERGTFEEVVEQCDALDAGGFSDFRVPSVKELQTLVDEAQPEPPRIDQTAFPGTPAELFWTSSSVVDDATAGWTVDFGAHGDAGFDSKSAEHHARCVRP